MIWPPFGPVNEPDDYRSPTFVTRVARSAEHGVVLTGPSRIGKTTLLCRLEESEPDRFGPVISLESGAGNALAKVAKLGKGRGRGVLLDEGQLLLRWAREDLERLFAALEGRPFVVAAWPSIFDPGASEGLQRWLEGRRFERLLPFSREEAAAMIRRARSEAPLACDDSIVEVLFGATGGYPALLAQLCGFLSDNGQNPLRRPDDEQLMLFVDSVQQFFNPFQAILGSLPRAHKDAVGGPSRSDRGRLACLVEHGLACDNPPRYIGKLFELAWGAPSSKPGPTVRPEPTKEPLRVRVLRWIHLSDVHFGAGDPSQGFDRQAVTRALRDDARSRAHDLGRPDRVFVTGDIAQRANPIEYEAARRWLEDLGEAVGVPLGLFRVVPGNHDVDRALADEKPAQRAHDAIRERPEEIDDDLFDPALRSNLTKKLGAYLGFVGSALASHPPPCPTGLDWSEALPAVPGLRGRIRIAGLSTVWVSDRFDGRDKRRPEGPALHPNLVVGRGQLEHTIGEAAPDVLLLLLSHHPPEWLDPKSAAWLKSALAPHAHVHLSGHVHDAQARAHRRFGREGTSFRYVAGASHGDPTETYGYAWGGVRWNGVEGRWEVGWAPRVYMPEMRRVVPDRNNHPDLDEDGFAWDRIALDWAPPGAEGR